MSEWIECPDAWIRIPRNEDEVWTMIDEMKRETAKVRITAQFVNTTDREETYTIWCTADCDNSVGDVTIRAHSAILVTQALCPNHAKPGALSESPNV